MENTKCHGRTFTYSIRLVHRYIGGFVLGLTLVYALSGVILVYRETDFLKSPVHVEKTLASQLAQGDLARELRLRHFKAAGQEGDILHFQDGTNIKDGEYNTATGMVSYTEKRFPPIIERIIGIHKLSSNQNMHWLSVTYGLALLFLAVSSPWMFKANTQKFKRVMLLSCVGLAVAVLLTYAI